MYTSEWNRVCLVCCQTSELDLVKPLLSSTYIENEVRLPVDRRDLVGALHHLMGEEIGEFTQQTASLRSVVRWVCLLSSRVYS